MHMICIRIRCIISYRITGLSLLQFVYMSQLYRPIYMVHWYRREKVLLHRATIEFQWQLRENSHASFDTKSISYIEASRYFQNWAYITRGLRGGTGARFHPALGRNRSHCPLCTDVYSTPSWLYIARIILRTDSWTLVRSEGWWLEYIVTCHSTVHEASSTRRKQAQSIH